MQHQELIKQSKEGKQHLTVTLEDNLFAASIMERLQVKPDASSHFNALADTGAVAEVLSFDQCLKHLKVFFMTSQKVLTKEEFKKYTDGDQSLRNKLINAEFKSQYMTPLDARMMTPQSMAHSNQK